MMGRLATIPKPSTRSVDAMIAERDELIRQQMKLREQIGTLQFQISKRVSTVDWSSIKLSLRQDEVLQRLISAPNLSNKELGCDLRISERTVKFHISRLLAKFKVTNRTELILCNHV